MFKKLRGVLLLHVRKEASGVCRTQTLGSILARVEPDRCS